MTGTMKMLADYATLVTAVAAAWAAYESRRSANASRAAAESQVVYQSMIDYFKPEMTDALRTLVKWREGHGDQYPALWLAAFLRGEQEAAVVDRARRHVKGFFDRAVRLREAKFVSEPAFREMAYTGGLNLYFDIVVPLENELNPSRRTRTEDVLWRDIGRYDADAPRA